MRGANAPLRLVLLSLLAGGAVILGHGTARSAADNGLFAVEDSGRMPCPAFLTAKSQGKESFNRAIGFIEGYISAANRYEARTFDLSPWHNAQSYALILEQHCKTHQSDNVGMAAQRLVIALQPLRLATPSKLIEVGNGKHRTVLYEAILRRAQSALARRGLYKGEVSGKFDPPTEAAILAFQRSAGLDPTGVPDPATLWKLLNP